VLAEAIVAVEAIDAERARADLEAASRLPAGDDAQAKARDAALASARARLRLAARPAAPH
jgi:hypothetical protein